MKTDQLRKLLDDGKVEIGLERAKQLVDSGKAKQVLLASNAPASQAARVKEFARLAGIAVTSLEATNAELGTMCRKPFPISFLTVI